MADPPEDPPAGEFPALPKAFNPLAAGAIGQLLDALRDGKTFSIDSPKKPSAGDTSVARRLWQSRIGQPVPPKPIDEAAELAQLAQMMKMAPDALVAASSGGWTLAFGRRTRHTSLPLPGFWLGSRRSGHWATRRWKRPRGWLPCTKDFFPSKLTA